MKFVFTGDIVLLDCSFSIKLAKSIETKLYIRNTID